MRKPANTPGKISGTTTRKKALEGLECFGVKLDEEKNNAPAGGDDISRPDSAVRIFVVDTNGEIIVARKAQALLQNNLQQFNYIR